jgi:hypothetical protein
LSGFFYLAHVLAGELVATPDQVGGQAFAGTCALFAKIPDHRYFPHPVREGESESGRIAGFQPAAWLRERSPWHECAAATP